MVQYNDNFIITPMSIKPGNLHQKGQQAYTMAAEIYGVSTQTTRNYCKGLSKDKKLYTEVRRWIWDNFQCMYHLLAEDGTVTESGTNF